MNANNARREPRLAVDNEEPDYGMPPLYDPDFHQPRRSAWGRWLVGFSVLAVLAGGGVWLALEQGGVKLSQGESIPLIRAPDTPAKVRPETPGGLEVPNRDKLVYNRVGDNGQPPRVENLLPPPETPLPPPAPLIPPKPAPVAHAGPAATVDLPTPVPAADPPGPTPLTPVKKEPEQVTVAAPPPPQAPVPPKKAASGAGSGPAQATETSPSAPDPKSQPNQVAKAAAAAPSPSAPKASIKTPLVQVAALRDRKSAQAAWKRLQARHKDLLGRLSPVIVRADLGAKGIYYRLRGGPLPDIEAAKVLCSQLKARQVGCLVVRP